MLTRRGLFRRAAEAAIAAPVAVIATRSTTAGDDIEIDGASAPCTGCGGEVTIRGGVGMGSQARALHESNR